MFYIQMKRLRRVSLDSVKGIKEILRFPRRKGTFIVMKIFYFCVQNNEYITRLLCCIFVRLPPSSTFPSNTFHNNLLRTLFFSRSPVSKANLEKCWQCGIKSNLKCHFTFHFYIHLCFIYINIATFHLFQQSCWF